MKKVVLILLLFSVVVAGGCSSQEPSLQDELEELDSDLQWIVSDFEFTMKKFEELERELQWVNAEYGDYIENVGVLGDSIGYCEVMADQLAKQLEELQEDIGDAMYRLNDIVHGDE